MPLKIRESGLQLEGSRGKDSSLPPQAFAITLSDNVIEDMIKCVQNGNDIKLALGATPTFVYGSDKHTITPPPDSYPYDLYLTQPFEQGAVAEKLPHIGSLFKKPSDDAPQAKVSAQRAERETEIKPKAANTNRSSGSSGLDFDLETLQSKLAAQTAARGEARMLDKLQKDKKGAVKAKTKLFPGSAPTPRSLPTSPAIYATGMASPTPALSASQQHIEQAKEERATFVHELAAHDRSLDYLKQRWTGDQQRLRPTLEKVADKLTDSDEWRMKKAYWKELDVWNYDYDNPDLRQKAIDNAIKHYDKQRLSASEPEWQKLLPKEERGKGKCLSILQANLAKGPPKINVQKADGGSTPKGDSDVEGTKLRAGAESMSRSSSNPLPSKAKKTVGSDTKTKKMFWNSKPKAAATKASTPKASAPKGSPTKTKATGVKSNSGRVLSKEIIENSDTSGDEAPLAKPKSQPKHAPPKPAAKPAEKTKDVVVAKTQAPKEPFKQQTSKRPREDDDSSSSSGTPLSKRHKAKQPLSSTALKHRPSDASLNSRGTATTNSSLKSKNTSPAKSSPLASSPPTNASDLETNVPPLATKKRKAVDDGKSLKAKRAAAAASLSSDLMLKAHRFKVFYEKYETLHYEISALDNPPNEKLANLLDMRDRLLLMKKEIYRDCPPAKA